MKSKYALILALMITILIATDVFFLKEVSEPGRKQVIIERVIDGDTLVYENGTRARLLNINTPEKNERGFDEASEFLSQLENQTIEIEEVGTDLYDRILIRVYAPEYLNLEIVETGLATKFLVDESELSDFNEAEQKAVENSRGMWEKSELSGCIDVSLSPEEEQVTLENHCSTDLTGFLIKDESRKKYIFPSVKSSRLILHTGAGDDNQTDLFWGSSQNVWNNDRDTLYLLDAEGKIAFHKSYGY